MNLFGKSRYLWQCLQERLARQPRKCPSCDCADSELFQRKYFISELRCCNNCKLMFRYPADSVEENHNFYQVSYSQGFTTDCPTDDELQKLLADKFQGSEKDFDGYLTVLESLGLPKGASILDYGCSWGYGTWQMRQSGFAVTGYEISRPRARYAREKLQIPVVSEVEDLPTAVDCFFSAHVLEHVPAVLKVVEFARRILKPGGLFVACTPNGSAPYRDKNPEAFRHVWGKVHPNVLTDEFYRAMFSGRPFILASSPYDQNAIREWDRIGQRTLDLSGEELLCVAVTS